MITPLAMSMFATSLAHNSTGAMFGANQSRMGLANSVTGNESMGEIASIASQDKALAMQGAMAKTNYQVAQAMQEGAAKLKKEHQEQRERMLQNGVIFF